MHTYKKSKVTDLADKGLPLALGKPDLNSLGKETIGERFPA